jgi:hypothetical protein
MLTRLTNREQSTPISEESRMSSARRQVAVVVGATSKWQADGRNTKLAHGKVLDDSDIPVGIRWGVGGAIAQKFAEEGFFERSPPFARKLVTRTSWSTTPAIWRGVTCRRRRSGRKRLTGQSLYYPRVMMRTLAQVLTEEYSEHGVHVANVVIDGLIDSPGTRALPRAQQHPEAVMNPVKIAEAFYYLHTQDKSCWTHELQLTPFATKPSF